MIAISGGPNTNSQAKNKLLHQTLGEVSYEYQRDAFSHVTAHSVIVRHPEEVPELIDNALQKALATRKLVYLEIPCNTAGQ